MQEDDKSASLHPATKPKLKIKAPPPKASTAPASRRNKGGSIVGRILYIGIVSAVIVAIVTYQRGQWTLPDHPLINKWLPSKQAPVVAPAILEEPPETNTNPSPDFWRNEDFIEGAKMFNRALADYKIHQQTPGDRALLASIKDNSQAAIARFEAALAVAPADLQERISDYINQCRDMLALVDVDESGASTGGEEPPVDLGIKIEMKGDAPKPKRVIVYEDDEPAPAPAAAKEEKTNRQTSRLSFDPSWDRNIPDAGGIADALHGLLRGQIAPSKEPALDAGIPVYSNITTLTSARIAASRLNQPLPVKRPLETPGFPANSLFTYTFEGEFMRGANRVMLVVDAMDRVVMSQVRFDQPVKAVLLPGEQHDVFDFLTMQRRVTGQEIVGHRVRVREQVVLIESELMELNPGADGSRSAKARIQWIIPRQMAGLMLGSRR